MSAPRRVDRELLDLLSSDNPRAIRSRADLRRVNAWMGQAGLMRRLLRRFGPTPPRTLIEIGSGDATFLLHVARRLAPEWPAISVRLIDRADLVTPATRAGFAALGWTVETIVADVFAALDTIGSADVICANLFLHHFEPPVLQRLLGQIAACSSFAVACEPARSTPALVGSRMLWALGCNDVTRHDAVVSVAAGFSGRELSALWPADAGTWRLDEQPVGLFSHGLVARREILQ